MADYIPPLENLIDQFQKLPGVGRKSATRLAFKLLEFPEEKAREFAEAIINAKTQIRECKKCFNISSEDYCNVCGDEGRDHSIICVVEDSKSLMAIDKVKKYNGVYHVLKGTISPKDGRSADDITIPELLARIDDSIEEVILATNPTIEGETTSLYINSILKDKNVKISRLAYGIPVGGDLEYADEVTLYRALEGRREIL
jgi:recombination protein RecR